jgi:hypothetical protein
MTFLLDENLSRRHAQTLRWTVARLAGLDLRGKLAVSDGRRIRIRS